MDSRLSERCWNCWLIGRTRGDFERREAAGLLLAISSGEAIRHDLCGICWSQGRFQTAKIWDLEFHYPGPRHYPAKPVVCEANQRFSHWLGFQKFGVAAGNAEELLGTAATLAGLCIQETTDCRPSQRDSTNGFREYVLRNGPRRIQ